LNDWMEFIHQYCNPVSQKPDTATAEHLTNRMFHLKISLLAESVGQSFNHSR